MDINELTIKQARELSTMFGFMPQDRRQSRRDERGCRALVQLRALPDPLSRLVSRLLVSYS